MKIDSLLMALGVARSKAPTEFVRFVAKYEMQLYPLLHPYGYKGSRVSDAATLDDFDRTYDVWLKRQTVTVTPGPTVGRPAPINADDEARRQMWAAAAADPIASVIIGLGAFTSATLGRLCGFEQDPKKAAVSGAAISTFVQVMGSLNTPHQVNEMVRQGETPKDRIKTVEGDNIRKVGPPAAGPPAGRPGGPRYTNSGAPGIDKDNCGQCTGAVLEGRGGTSSSFAARAGVKEGLTDSPLSLSHQFQAAGNRVGDVKQTKSMVELFQQLKALPVGTNVALIYYSPKEVNTIGHAICAMVGQGKDILFVDAQMSPPQVVAGPAAGANNFYYFTVTPAQR